MRNEEIKLYETYYTRVSGALIKVEVIGETKDYRGRRMWNVRRKDNLNPLSPRNAQALHLTSNPAKEREERGKDKAEDKIRELNKQRFRRCLHCGRPAASPASNLCGDALMGRTCTSPQRETYIPGNDQRCETPETIVHDCGPEPDLDLDAETVS